MASTGGVVVAAALTAAVALAGCSGGGGGAPGSEAARATTTATTESGERSWGSPPATTVPPERIPWEAVVELAAAPTGRLVRTGEAVWPDGDNRLGGTEASTDSITFDRGRGLALLRTTMTGPDGEDVAADLFTSEDGTLLAADWVEARCGARWVAVPTWVLPEGSAFGPLDALGAAKPSPGSGAATETATPYEVDLPAALVPGAGFLGQQPEVAEALEGQTTTADVTIRTDGTLVIVQQLPVAALTDAGADLGELGRLAPTAAIQATWRLEGAGEPVDIPVPTDVADDPSCAE